MLVAAAVGGAVEHRPHRPHEVDVARVLALFAGMKNSSLVQKWWIFPSRRTNTVAMGH